MSKDKVVLKSFQDLSQGMKEKEAAAITAAPSTDLLAEVSKVEIPVITDEILNDGRKKAAEEKEAADKVGTKLTEIRREKHRIQYDPQLKDSSVGQKLIAQLDAAEKKLKSIGDETFQKRAENYALVEEIRRTDRAHLGEVREIFKRVHEKELRRFLSKEEIEAARKDGKWLDGAIFFEGKVSISPFKKEDRTGFHRALEAELRILIDAAKLSKAASIKARGNADLSGFVLGKPGHYYLFSPARTGKDGHKFSEGHALIEVKDVNKGKADRKPYVVADIRDATGSLTWMANGKWLPLFWITKGRVVTSEEKRLEKEDFDRAVRMIRTIRALVINWREEYKPVENAIVEALANFCIEKKAEAEEKPIETTAVPTVSAEEAAGRVNAVPETDMSGVKVEEVSKSKKVKKAE